MRIIAGTLGGRRLRCPAGREVRPTGDRLKESLFNILAPILPGARFLDLFAGTGAIGLEAWSRGATAVVCVEQNRAAQLCLRANVETCGVENGFRLLACPVAPALKRLAAAREQFDLVFLDPPYQSGVYPRTIAAISALDLLSPTGWIVAEHPRAMELSEVRGGLRAFRRHVVGDSGLTFFEKN